MSIFINHFGTTIPAEALNSWWIRDTQEKRQAEQTLVAEEIRAKDSVRAISRQNSQAILNKFAELRNAGVRTDGNRILVKHTGSVGYFDSITKARDNENLLTARLESVQKAINIATQYHRLL